VACELSRGCPELRSGTRGLCLPVTVGRLAPAAAVLRGCEPALSIPLRRGSEETGAPVKAMLRSVLQSLKQVSALRLSPVPELPVLAQSEAGFADVGEG